MQVRLGENLLFAGEIVLIILISSAQEAGNLGFLSHIIIVNFNAEQDYSKLQVTNIKIKEDATNCT